MAVSPRANDVDPGTAILDAGRRLITERGSGFTTQDLIKEAGVALQTFYRYYGGKDQLLLALIAEVIAGHATSLYEVSAEIDDPLERLELYVRATTEARGSSEVASGAAQFITAEHWRLHQIFPEEIARATEPMTALVRDALESGCESGVFTTDRPDHAAWLITKTLMSVFHHLAYMPDDPAAPDADGVWAFCRAAVTAPKPPRRRKRRS